MAEEGEVEVLAGRLQQYDELISSLAAVSRGSVMPLRNYHGCWFPEVFLPGALAQYDELISSLEMFCNGMSAFGPIWDHWLGYWRESLKRPDKVLFLKYEQMKEQPVGNLRKLAGFLGCPFSREEESEGVPEKIVSLCSFKKLSSSEVVNKGERGLKGFVWKSSSFFRKGEVGDWKNYFTTEMATKLDAIVEEKLLGSGLSFGNS